LQIDPTKAYLSGPYPDAQKELGSMFNLALVRRFDPVPVLMMSVGVLLGAMLVLVF
jgi:hypothetical protein